MTPPAGILSNRSVVRSLADAVYEAAADLDDLWVMHVCGTHEHEMRRHALRQLLPANVHLVAGPGCPVCITPASVIATAIAIALRPERPILCTYGDMARVPIDRGSLFESRRDGADVRIIYSIRDTLAVAQENPERPVVFFSVGFETTAAPVAAMLRSGVPDNFFVYACHRYVPPAVRVLAASDSDGMHGFLLPGHASVITGEEPYRFLPDEFGKASAIAGFEPADILAGMLSILRQVHENRPAVANCYPRAVRPEGNRNAQAAIEDVFRRSDAPWRGIGTLPGTGLVLNDRFSNLDALARFGMAEVPASDILPGCICHLIMLGKHAPDECPHFGTSCTPEHPHGPCMVSTEGTCRAHYLYPEPDHA
jgi:hydrogenase expression/formation protein HypD